MAADPITANTVNDLLSYDVSDDDDPFGDALETKPRDDKATLSPRSVKRKADEDKENIGLGLDEEVKITKKRKPIAKLDETRLLSQPGIPKLRTLTRSGHISKKLRLKGKGHEFSDAGRLLNYFQLWLDDLYPRANFADGLQLVEKAGHSKRMQIMRREWIDEGKPGYARDKALRRQQDGHDDISGKHEMAGAIPPNPNGSEPIFGNPPGSSELFFPDRNNALRELSTFDPDDDELDALLAGNTSTPKRTVQKNAMDSEGEDDLDALLAEQDNKRQNQAGPGTSRLTARRESHSDDDLDALLAERETRVGPPEQRTLVKPQSAVFDNDDDDEDEDDDLDALLAEQESRNEPTLPSALPEPPTTTVTDEGDQSNRELSQEYMEGMLSSSPLPNEVGDLDALFAEHEAQNEKRQNERVPEQDESQDNMLSSSPLPNDDSDL